MPRQFGRLAGGVAAAIITVQLTACGSIGDMGSINEASEFAVDCQPDKAVAALENAHQAGGLSSYIAMLEKVVVLRDAGRTAAADAAFEEYMALPEVDPADREEAEDSIEGSVDELRRLRQDKTGNPACPGT